MAFRYDFTRLETRDDLLEVLAVEAELFDGVIAFDPPVAAAASVVPTSIVEDIPMFVRHDIPKKNKARGHRTCWEATLAKSTYKALARRLDLFFRAALPDYPHAAAFGYRAGRNIRENAMAHSGHRHLLSLDIQDFFPSISTATISSRFEAMGIAPLIADLLARFVTIGGGLPLGLPTSPTISNLIALPIDRALDCLARRVGATYTRYSDDMSFSSNDVLPQLEDVRTVLAAQGFALAEKKTRRSKRGQAHYVTGLSISDALPHVPKQKKRQLRQELYFAGKFGLADHFHHRGVNDQKVIQQQVNRIDGMVKFVAHHEPQMVPALTARWRDILRDNLMKPSFAPRGQHRAPFYLLVDEAEFQDGTGTVLALCIAVTQHPTQIVDETNSVLRKALSDMFADGDVEALRRKGLHFADATEDLRLAYVRRLITMPFEGYVAFCRLDDHTAYEVTYLRLLSAIIKRRLMAAESQFALLYVEQNNKVAQSAIKAVVQDAFETLKAEENRRPAALSVEFVTKPNPAISVPDFLLGVLGRYLRSKPAPDGKPEPRERLTFERLRDKYRLILDVGAWTEYSRRRPIEPWSDA